MKIKSFLIKALPLLMLPILCALFSGCSKGKDFTSYVKEYDAALTAVKLKLDVSEIEVKAGEGDKITLHYYDTEENFFSVNEENGVLNVSRANLGELQENIRFGLGMKKYYKVILTVPAGYSGDITLETTSGDITVKDIVSQNEKVSIKSDSGDVKVSDVIFGTLTVDGRTSETVLKKINVSDLNVVTVAGEVILSDSECAKYTVKGEAAEVDLKNVSLGQVSVTVTTGDADFTNVKVGSTTYISATAGDISVDGLDTGSCTVSTENGDIYLENLWIGSDAYLISKDGDIEAYISDSVTGFTIDSVSEYGKNNLQGITGFNGFKNLIVRNVTGDINVRFS